MTAATTALHDVIVVGGGVAGATLNLMTARAGLDTLLLDEGLTHASGASSVPAALLNAHRGRSGRASAADLAGLADFWDLTRDLEALGFATGAFTSGVIRIADNPKQARAWQRVAAGTWLEPNDVPAAYHAPFGALLLATGGWVAPSKLLAALEAAAKGYGGATRRGVRVDSLVEEASFVTVATSAGQLRARRVVLCLGAARPPHIRLPQLETIWGEALVLTGAVTAPYPVAGAVVAAFENGTVYVSGGHSSSEPPERQGAAALGGNRHPLQRALAWQVPAVDGATAFRHWQGARAKRRSGEPVARRLTKGTYYFGALGGRGFLRAATLATALAARLHEELTR